MASLLTLHFVRAHSRNIDLFFFTSGVLAKKRQDNVFNMVVYDVILNNVNLLTKLFLFFISIKNCVSIKMFGKI